jgi:hypothetical protein
MMPKLISKIFLKLTGSHLSTQILIEQRILTRLEPSKRKTLSIVLKPSGTSTIGPRIKRFLTRMSGQLKNLVNNELPTEQKLSDLLGCDQKQHLPYFL